MVDVALKHDEVNSATISYDETIKASFNELTVDLEVIDDSRAEEKRYRKN
jgi:hypothetical protein